MMMTWQPKLEGMCPERPELLAGAPIGMYHCPACGCMVLAGIPHVPHDIGCWLSLENECSHYTAREYCPTCNGDDV